MRSDELHPVRSEPAGSSYAMWVGLVCVAFGFLTLAGWYGNVRTLEAFGPWHALTRPIAALSITFLGAALATRSLVRARAVSVILAGAGSALGLLGLIDHARPTAGIATGFAVHALRIAGARGMPPIAAPTAVCLIALGAGIVLTWRMPGSRWASACAFVAAVPPSAIFVAYVYDLHLRGADLNRMSLPTALAVLVLASALWWMRGERSAVRVLGFPGPGGSLARRLVPIGIVVPLILGWPAVVAVRTHIFGSTMSVAVGQVEVAVLLVTAVFWAAVSIDRTERRRREAAALSEHRGVQLANAQRIARVGSWERDVVTGRLDWSAELHRLLGYEVGTVVPSFEMFLDRVAQQDRPRVIDTIQKAVAAQSPFSMEFSIVLPDGTSRRMESQGDVETEQGEPVRVVGVARDVTEQRRVEEALRESEDRYRIIIEGAAEGIWVSDARGSTSLVNARMAEMLGYSIEELTSMPLSHLLKDGGSSLIRRVNARRRAGLVDRYEVEVVRKDGNTVWVSVSANPLRSSSGDFLGSLAMISDISARKEAEAALQDAYEREREAVERLRSIDDMKDAFLTAVSHELRTPLTGVVGFAATLQRHGTSLSAEERATLTDRLVHNADRLQHMLADLLDLDRLKRGLIAPHRRLLGIEELIRGVAEHVDVGLHPLQIDVVPGLDAFVDGPKVERIVENLLNNAVRHTEAGARIWLSASACDGGIVIAVDDDGPGVDDHSKSVIFEPFRTGSIQKTYSPGTGIGLSLVSRFAELHGGRSWIEDRPGGGSSFKVFLPRGEADAPHLSSGAA